MTIQKLSKWRITTKILAATVSLSVPVLALAFFGSSALALLLGPTAGAGEFRLLSPAPTPSQASKTEAAPQNDDETAVELTNWEKTGHPASPSK